MAKNPDNFRSEGVPESMPKNPMMADPAMQAMQKGLVKAKKNKPMKVPMKRQRTIANFAKKAM